MRGVVADGLIGETSDDSLQGSRKNVRACHHGGSVATVPRLDVASSGGANLFLHFFFTLCISSLRFFLWIFFLFILYAYF